MWRWSMLVVLTLLAGAACATSRHGDDHAHRFQDAERWARVFDDPARDEWQKPDEVIRALALAPGSVVADLGAGTGYFTVRLARALPEGRVLGIDVEPDMVHYLAERAKREGLANVTSIEAAPDDPHLPGPVDLVLVVDTYHHIASRVAYFTRLLGALREGGRVAIIDVKENAPHGPPPASRIPAPRVLDEMARAGYMPVAIHDLLPYQYFLVFAPAGR
jgi:cyclopropane fatty-acyl-phospholipid synthase-like methyltransferase